MDNKYYENGKNVMPCHSIIMDKFDDVEPNWLVDEAIQTAVELNYKLGNTISCNEEWWFQEGYRNGYMKCKQRTIKLLMKYIKDSKIDSEVFENFKKDIECNTCIK